MKKKTIYLFLIFFLTLNCFQVLGSNHQTTINVQTSKGSFNHQAILKLTSFRQYHDVILQFSGSHQNTLLSSAKSDNLAFFAVSNRLIKENLVNQAIESMRSFSIEIKDYVVLPIDICLITKTSTPFKQVEYIASHPAAIQQISDWLIANPLKVIEEIKGTSEAARKLSQGEYDSNTAIAGSCLLTTIYPNLTVISKSIQDKKIEKNETLFLLTKVKVRPQKITRDQAKSELIQTLKNAIPTHYLEGFIGSEPITSSQD